MKKKIRGFLAGTILSSILFIILGVLFIIFPLKIDGTLYLILFSALLILGGGQIIFFFRRDKRNMADSSELVFGPALFLAAFFVYFRWYDELNSLSQYLFAFLIAVSGFRKLQNALQLKYLEAERWALLLLAAAAGAIYGGVLMFVPFEDGHRSALLFRLLGSGFIYSGVSDIAASVWVSMRLRERRLEEKLREKEKEKEKEKTPRAPVPTKEDDS